MRMNLFRVLEETVLGSREVVSRFVLKMPEPPPCSRRWPSREYLREVDPAVDLPQLNLATRIEPKE